MRQPEDIRSVLEWMAHGAVLKIHRDVDGSKRYLVHPLDGAPIPIGSVTISRMKRTGLICSNQKFPASTYLLTEKALALLNLTEQDGPIPISPRGFPPG